MKVSLVFVLLLVPFLAKTQHTPHTLKQDNMLEELVVKTNYFDSVLIIDKASYWSDLRIRGFGFKGKSIFKVEISFTENHENDLHVKSLDKSKLSKPKSLQRLLKKEYASVSALHDDSLNLRPPRLTPNDQEIWTVLMINNRSKSQTLKQSYAPLFYQKTIPTRQRRFFIEFVQKIEGNL